MTVIIRRIILIGCLISGFALETFGQLNITGEIRPRTEFRNGFKTFLTEEESPAIFTEQRSRISLHYREEALTFCLSAQEVRIWGNNNQIYKTDPSLFNMYEAWGKYALSNTLAIKIGRQALGYDNARFLGDLDWAQQGRSHDALLLTYEDSLGTKVHLGAGFNQSLAFEPGKLTGTFYEDRDNYKTMQFIWLHKDFEKSYISLLMFNDGRQQSDQNLTEYKVNFRQTIGLLGQKQLDKLNLEGELYYQGGKDPLGLNTSAWLASANITFKTSLIPLSLGVDYLSGSEPGSDVNRAFNPLYGTNHKFYGLMDHYYVGNSHAQSGAIAGLKNFFLKTNFKLSNSSNLMVHLHHFESAVPIYGSELPTERLSGSLGEEIDLVLNKKLTKDIMLNMGYSQMFGTESSETLKGKSNTPTYQCWVWAMMSFKPLLFASQRPNSL